MKGDRKEANVAGQDILLADAQRPYGLLTSFRFKESCKILVGPIIGKVTHDSAIVLLEVDRKSTVGIQVCIAGGFDAHDVPLAPEPPDSLGFGPDRAGIQRERLVRTMTLKMLARRPRSIKIDGLSENTTYRIVLTGVSLTMRQHEPGHSVHLPSAMVMALDCCWKRKDTQNDIIWALMAIL